MIAILMVMNFLASDGCGCGGLIVLAICYSIILGFAVDGIYNQSSDAVNQKCNISPITSMEVERQ